MIVCREVVTCVLACAVLACGGGGGDRKGVLVVQDSAVVSGNTPSSPGKSVAGGAPRRTILFLGTSLTAGLGLEPDSAYPQQVQRRIDAAGLPYQALNAGVSGETSAGLLRRLDWVLQDSAAVIVVETGANDGLRGQSVEATKVTIGEILTRIRKERPEARVVLVQMEAPTNLGTVYTRAFHAMFPALAAEHHVTLMPFLLTGVAGVVALNQGDGVHPNLAGERMVAATVWRALEPLVRWTGRPPIAPPAPKR